MSDLLRRVAGAPITWGVDGSPGWGHLMDRGRVLSEMAAVGLRATELGPDGYLPRDPAELHEYVSTFGLQIVGGFVPAVLYHPERVEADLAYTDRAARQLAAAGSDVLVLGPDSHHDGYDTSVAMDDRQWRRFLANLRRLQDIVDGHGLRTGLHPHWGMAIERQEHVERLLASSDVGLCLDTGHLFVGGADPVEIAKLAAGRVVHVHLKDANADAARRVRAGEVPFRQAVIDGMFRPLGEGDIDIVGVIQQLEGAGFEGWYVLEQDTALVIEPAVGAGPQADAETSVRFLRQVAGLLGEPLAGGTST